MIRFTTVALTAALVASATQAMAQGSRVEVVPACGHIPQAEQMETTLALVRDFMRGQTYDGQPC